MTRWALHNPLKGWTLYDLTQEEAQVLVNSLSPNEIRLCRVCDLREKKWESLDPQKYGILFSSKGKIQGLFPAMDQLEKTSSEDLEYFIVKPQKRVVPRLHQRLEVELPVTIENHSQTFQSKTIDISEGGLCLKDLIPDWVSGYFIAKVFFNSKVCQLMCSLVEDQKIRQRIQIVSEDSDSHFMEFKKMLSQYEKSLRP